jgi:hypothetical protein
MNDALRWLDIGLKALPALAALVFLAISHSFVTRDEYLTTSDKFSGRIEQIEKLLIRMESSAETDKRHDAAIADHEGRIRALESHHQ